MDPTTLSLRDDNVPLHGGTGFPRCNFFLPFFSPSSVPELFQKVEGPLLLPTWNASSKADFLTSLMEA